MKSEIRKRIMQKFIMNEFVSGNINTKNDVENMLVLIMLKLDMSAAEAKDLFRESIGAK